MSGTILLFGFDSLLNILALSAAVAPFDAEVVPVARGDYNKPMGVLAGLDTEAAPSMAVLKVTFGSFLRRCPDFIKDPHEVYRDRHGS